MNIAIRAEALSKQYSIADTQRRHDTLRDQIAETFRSYLPGRRRTGKEPGTFWALRGVSFEIRPGEIIGLIGRNGAGKSTLLKLLSRITEPTYGRAEIYGRVGSLLEVGTGFDRELTGRENIFLSGAILGMKNAEITSKFDEIVAFAEVERFLDTPVKQYSSGMYMRLAFAVAAHLDPEILLVDEVLAVGDAAFQKKCLSRMATVAKGGRTVLFVSHNMGAVLRLCSRCLWLDQGKMLKTGAAPDLVREYISAGASYDAVRTWDPQVAPGDSAMRLLRASVSQPENNPTSSIDMTAPFQFSFEAELIQPVPEASLGIRIITSDGQVALHTTSVMSQATITTPGRWRFVCRLPAYALNSGDYVVSIGADIPNRRAIFYEESALAWRVEPLSTQMSRYQQSAWGGVLGPGLADWYVEPN